MTAGPNLCALPQLGRRSSSASREATVAGARAARSSFPLRAASAQGGGPQSGRAPPTLRAAGEPEDGGGGRGRPGGGGAEAAEHGSKRQRSVAAARQRPRPHGYLNTSRELRPASLARLLARGPGRRGHGRQAERPRRQRPHPRLLGLGPALRDQRRRRGGRRSGGPVRGLGARRAAAQRLGRRGGCGCFCGGGLGPGSAP